MRLPTIGTKLHGSVQRSRDGLTVGHPEFEEHTQHVVSLADQYAFGGTDHFDPEEVMKVPQILHVKGCHYYWVKQHSANYLVIM